MHVDFFWVPRLRYTDNPPLFRQFQVPKGRGTRRRIVGHIHSPASVNKQPERSTEQELIAGKSPLKCGGWTPLYPLLDRRPAIRGFPHLLVLPEIILSTYIIPYFCKAAAKTKTRFYLLDLVRTMG